jgi:hypothetical protein
MLGFPHQVVTVFGLLLAAIGAIHFWHMVIDCAVVIVRHGKRELVGLATSVRLLRAELMSWKFEPELTGQSEPTPHSSSLQSGESDALPIMSPASSLTALDAPGPTSAIRSRARGPRRAKRLSQGSAN